MIEEILPVVFKSLGPAAPVLIYLYKKVSFLETKASELSDKLIKVEAKNEHMDELLKEIKEALAEMRSDLKDLLRNK